MGNLKLGKFKKLFLYPIVTLFIMILFTAIIGPVEKEYHGFLLSLYFYPPFIMFGVTIIINKIDDISGNKTN